MICTSIQGKGLEEILELLEKAVPAIEMAEIRLDRCPLDEEEIEELFSTSDTPLVATCRAGSDGPVRSGACVGSSDLFRPPGNHPGSCKEASCHPDGFSGGVGQPDLSPPAGHARGLSWAEAESRLLTAIKAGAAYADLEIEAPPQVGKRLRRACSEYGVTMIRSCHFFEGTPALEALQEAARRCSRFGGEIVKIVGMAHSEADAGRVLSLYEYAGAPRDGTFERAGTTDPTTNPRPGGACCEPFEGSGTAPDRLIAFAMGEAGRESRLECLKCGAPFTYAALTEEAAAAPGQWDYPAMRKAVYGCLRFPEEETRTPEAAGEETPTAEEGHGKAELVLNMPSSKSFAQRAILAAALADGESHLGGYSPCGDNEAALEVAGMLGAEVRTEGTDVTMKGIGAMPGCLALDRIQVGESGLLTRLTIPLLAALDGEPVRIDGCGTLLDRPLKGAAEIMAYFGTLLRPDATTRDASGTRGSAAEEPHVPLTVQGPLLAGRADISGKDGSQLVSGLLAALPLLPEDSTLHIHEPKSIPYLFITLDVLRRFGICIGSEMEGDEDFIDSQDWGHCSGITFRIKGGQRYKPASFDIEGDWSAAANFLVAGAVFGKVQLEGIDTTSLQADISIMDILLAAGASLSQLEAENNPDDHRGTITVQRAPLRAFDTDLGNCPDLFPIVSVLAAFCSGRSHIQGFKRLRGKESDRGRAILRMLAQMGVPASAEGDTMTVEGESLASRCLNGRLLRGGSYTSSHDHRMVMALKVASLGADGPLEIDDTACVAKSFPGFPEMFGLLARETAVRNCT